jgi:hypothetical protein
VLLGNQVGLRCCALLDAMHRLRNKLGVLCVAESLLISSLLMSPQLLCSAGTSETWGPAWLPAHSYHGALRTMRATPEVEPRRISLPNGTMADIHAAAGAHHG